MSGAKKYEGKISCYFDRKEEIADERKEGYICLHLKNRGKIRVLRSFDFVPMIPVSILSIYHKA